jgi:hypothetical protein
MKGILAGNMRFLASLLGLVTLLVQSCRPTQALTPTAESTEEVEGSDLKTLLGYAPLGWADLHLNLPLGYGPAIYYIDFAQMRNELGIPSTLNSASSRQDKLALITKIDTQDLSYFPDGIEPASSSAFDAWGWDSADIMQALYLPDLKAAILRGTFNQPRINDRLEKRGFTSRHNGEFTYYTNDLTSLEFALKPDILIVAQIIVGSRSTIDAILDSKKNQLYGLDQHPSVSPILRYFDGAWGIILSPSNNLAGNPNSYDQMSTGLPPEIWKMLNERYGLDKIEYEEPVWDFMGIGYRGILEGGKEQGTSITMVYHYLANSEAVKDIELIRGNLTSTPSFEHRGETWGDLLDVDNIKVDDTLLVVQATTKRKYLIGGAFNHDDQMVFFPYRYHTK